MSYGEVPFWEQFAKKATLAQVNYMQPTGSKGDKDLNYPDYLDFLLYTEHLYSQLVPSLILQVSGSVILSVRRPVLHICCSMIRGDLKKRW